MADAIVNLAVIGVGGIWNGAHLKNLKHLGGNRIAAVCDINPANLQRALDATGARGYDDMEKLFAAEREVDAVIACTPPTVRLQVVEGAARRHWPLFVEKPPSFTLDDTRAILRVIRQAQAPVAVGFMYRYLEAADRLKALIAGQPINLVQSYFLCPAATGWPIPAWFYIKERSGGHVLDQAIHVLDLIRYLAGDITQVCCLGNNVIRPKTPEFTVEDSSSTNMRFASGASGCHVHSWAHREFTGGVTVIGKDYRLTLELDRKLRGFVGEQKIDEEFPAPPQGCSHHYTEMRTFLQAVREKQFGCLRSPFCDAAKSLATVLAMNQSIDAGKPVAVALDL